jgi:hypothetical protein
VENGERVREQRINGTSDSKRLSTDETGDGRLDFSGKKKSFEEKEKSTCAHQKSMR